MANFQYTQFDLQRPLLDVLGGPHLTLESFGLNDRIYKKIERMDSELENVGKNSLSITDILKKYRCTADQFKRLYALAQLWNHFSYCKKQTLFQFLNFYHDKACMFHPLENIPSPSSHGNLLDYLSSFDILWLSSVGW